MITPSRISWFLVAGLVVTGMTAPARALSSDPLDQPAPRPDVVAQVPTQPTAQAPAGPADRPATETPTATRPAEPVETAAVRPAPPKPRLVARAPSAQAHQHRVARAAAVRPAPARNAYMVAARLERAYIPLFLGVGY